MSPRKQTEDTAARLRGYAAFVPTLARYQQLTPVAAYARQAEELATLVARHAELAARGDAADAEMHRRAGADAARKARLCQLLAAGQDVERAVAETLTEGKGETRAGAGTVAPPTSAQPKRPRRDAAFWRAAAADLQRTIDYKTKNPYPGRRLTPARRRDWQCRLDQAHEDACWQGTLARLAAAVAADTLPAILYGLTNALQVRTLLRYVPGSYYDTSGPHNLGPTIKTIEQLRAAAAAVNIYVCAAPKLYVPDAGDVPTTTPPEPVDKPRADDAPLLQRAA